MTVGCSVFVATGTTGSNRCGCIPPDAGFVTLRRQRDLPPKDPQASYRAQGPSSHARSAATPLLRPCQQVDHCSKHDADDFKDDRSGTQLLRLGKVEESEHALGQ